MVINTIDTKDISVVVQGAIDKEYTPLCLKSIRKYLPESEIILSTWEGSDVDNLDYDVLVLNRDPGAKLCAPLEGRLNNLNRQIVSTKNGIIKSKNKFCYKIRTDIILLSNNFLNYFYLHTNDMSNKYNIFTNKILISSIWTRFRARQENNIMLQPYHISDWHMIGLKEDILFLYDIPLENDFDATEYYMHNRRENFDAFEDHKWRYTPEQYIFYKCIKKKIPNLLFNSKLDYNKKHMKLYYKLIANNFIVIDKDMWNFMSFKHNLKYFLSYMNEDIITYKKYLNINLLYKPSFENIKKRVKYKENINDKNCVIGELKWLKNIELNYDNISFDIFDTLLLRNVDPSFIPTSKSSLYIHMLINQYTKKSSINEINYLRDVFVEETKIKGDEEYLFDEYVEYLLNHYKIPDKEVEKLKNIIIDNEINREIECLYLNEDVIEILEYLKKSGKKIFAISDMYISKSSMIKIMQHFDIYKYFEDIFVSSEYKALKFSGKLFRIFMLNKSILPSEFIHIGDNKISDFDIPKSMYINAIWYNDINSFNRRKKLSDFYLYGDNKSKYLGEWFKTENIKPINFRDYVIKYFSIDFINFVYSIIIKSQTNNIEAIYFLERDGNIFHDIYNILINEITILKDLKKIDLYLTNLSRKDSACLIDINDASKIISRANKINSSYFSITKIIEAFGLLISDFPKNIQKIIIEENNNINYFYENYKKIFLPYIENRRKSILEYLKKKNINKYSHIALCDIGWGGTTQNDISTLFEDINIYGYYYGTDIRINNIRDKAYGYHIGEKLYFTYSLLEFIIKKYNQPDDKLLDYTYKLNNISRDAIIEQAHLFASVVNKYSLLPYQIKEYSQSKVINFVKYPDYNFVKTIKNVYFSLDRKVGDEYIPLIEKYNSRNKLDNIIEKAGWYHGSVIYTHPIKSKVKNAISIVLNFIYGLFPYLLIKNKSVSFEDLSEKKTYKFFNLKITIKMK